MFGETVNNIMEKDLDFGLGDRDSVLKTLIKHDESHMGVVEPQRVSYWGEQTVPDTYTYWSHYADPVVTGKGISLAVMPSWGVIFPPYGTARLTGVLRQWGHRVVVHDINIKAYQHVLKQGLTNWWNSIYYYSWENPAYWTDVHDHIKPILDASVDELLNDGTELIGFTLYQTNILASLYVITEIKKRDPSKRIVVGGPEAFNDWFDYQVQNDLGFDVGLIDFRVTGEGEQELLTLLENLDAYPMDDRKPPVVLGGFKSKLDLNSLPFPDYTDYNLSLYDHPDGTSIETSRGCVAKCSFCAETHFWKFRWTNAERTIEEIRHQRDKYGVRRFWFVDSLANGNFKEFKQLIALMKEANLGIRWNSYARNDGRMDLQMFKDIVKTGCATLSFGVESGSQRVLDDMQKKVEVWEIEANLRDGRIAGMQNHCNWIVGFPTEGRQEFMHSLALLWNTRKDMFAISLGYTCGDAPFSDMQLGWEKYGIAWDERVGDNRFLSNWFTKNYANTILHRFLRLKFTNILMDIMKEHTDATVLNTQARPSIRESYSFTPSRERFNERIEQTGETFDWYMNQDPALNLSATLANEYHAFAWILFKAFGPHEFTMSTSPDIDLPEFGTFVTNYYYSTVTWNVNRSGKINFELTHSFEHRTLKDDPAVEKLEVKRQKMSFKSTTYRLEEQLQVIAT